jgi:hypothetical protein
MVYPISYRRPAHVSRTSSARGSLSGNDKQKSIDESVRSGSSGMSHGIPEALSFDRIISGGTCPVSPAPALRTLVDGPADVDLADGEPSRAPPVTS